MKLFNTLALEITARCNRRCVFCPVAYNHRPDERMDWSMVQKAAAELASIDYRGRIEFYIYNEPMKDREYLSMCLSYFRRMVPLACLMIATNGDYIKHSEDIVNLFLAGLNQLLINCYSPGLYTRRLPWLDALPGWINRKGNVYAVVSPRNHMVQMLDKSNPDEFGSGIFRLVNRAGNINEFMPALEQPVSRMCVKPFRLLNVNWRGEALVCCNDYHGEVSYGNLNQLSLIELWNHPVMNTYRDHLLSKDRSLPLCRACDCHAGAYSHNVCSPDPIAPRAGADAVRALQQARRAAQGRAVALPLLVAEGPQGGR